MPAVGSAMRPTNDGGFRCNPSTYLLSCIIEDALRESAASFLVAQVSLNVAKHAAHMLIEGDPMIP